MATHVPADRRGSARAIEGGDLEPGQQLRTEIELRDHYGASRNTIRDAIKLLTAWGMVETRPGQGTFVVRKIEPYVTTLTGSPKVPILYGEVDDSAAGATTGTERILYSTDPQVEIQKAAASVGRLLQIAEGSQVISRIRSVLSTEPRGQCRRPFTRWDSSSRADRLIQADDIAIGTMKYLEETLGLSRSDTARIMVEGRRLGGLVLQLAPGRPG